MASTPPPPSPTYLRVPGAPRHGAGYDIHSPYPTRYSTRLASQRASKALEQNPSICPSSPNKLRSKSSAKKNVREDVRAISPPTTTSLPNASSSNPTARSLNYSTRKPGSLTYEPVPHPNSHLPSSTHALPTPVKTPSKKKVSIDQSTARTLFPSGTMSKKQPIPFSLESFESAPGQAEIAIFTDSRDRVPKASNSLENPFITRPQEDAPRATEHAPRATRSSTRPSGSNEIRYMFRGKQVIEEVVSDTDEEGDSDDNLGLFKNRPDLLPEPSELAGIKGLSRSSILPRALWPSKDHKSLVIEEDATDESVNKASETLNEVSQDAKLAEKDHDAFHSPSPAPHSAECTRAPGATRTLRSNARFDGDIEVTPSIRNPPGVKRKRISPFDRWQRKKGKEASTESATSPAKRGAVHPDHPKEGAKHPTMG